MGCGSTTYHHLFSVSIYSVLGLSETSVSHDTGGVGWAGWLRVFGGKRFCFWDLLDIQAIVSIIVLCVYTYKSET